MNGFFFIKGDFIWSTFQSKLNISPEEMTVFFKNILTEYDNLNEYNPIFKSQLKRGLNGSDYLKELSPRNVYTTKGEYLTNLSQLIKI